jgi:hypothetical protein
LIVKALARKELESEDWLRIVARESHRSYRQVRVAVLVFNITPDSCIVFLDPLIVSWDVDLASFGLEIVLNRRIAPANLRKLEFVERESIGLSGKELGLQELLKEWITTSGDSQREVER